MKSNTTVEIRQKLWGRIVEIAEDEGMDAEDLVDHALRAYVEGYEFVTEDEEE